MRHLRCSRAWNLPCQLYNSQVSRICDGVNDRYCRVSCKSGKDIGGRSLSSIAMHTAGVPAQMFGTEMLITLAKSPKGKRLMIGQGTVSVLCDGIADGRIKVWPASCVPSLVPYTIASNLELRSPYPT